MNIIHLKYPTQYDVTSSFVRLQEFYESPIEDIRGKFFTMDTFMDAYSKKNNNIFSYFEDWAGFNIPGNVVNDFYRVFGRTMRDKEYEIYKTIRSFATNQDGNYYIVGTSTDDEAPEITINHELAHALFYLSPEYREAASQLVGQMNNSVVSDAYDSLVDQGYCEEVLLDEFQAYMATGFPDRLFSSHCKRLEKDFRTLFALHKPVDIIVHSM